MENPPIYRALQRGWNEIAEFLLDQQCNVNQTTANGMTCFFAAAHCNRINIGDIARRLLKTGTKIKLFVLSKKIATRTVHVSILRPPFKFCNENIIKYFSAYVLSK